MSSKSTFKNSLEPFSEKTEGRVLHREERVYSGRPEKEWPPERRRNPAALLAALALLGLASANLGAQTVSGTRLPLEDLVYPLTRLCLLDVRGTAMHWPFNLDFFRTDLEAYLRSADYLTIRTESDVAEIIERNRAQIPDTYNPQVLTRVGRLTDCQFVAYLRLISLKMDHHDGFSVPILFKRNKVTYSGEIDLALVDSEKGTLQYSTKVIGGKSVGRSVQVYPVTEDPSTHLSFLDKEELAGEAMQDLARRTFEALMTGMHKDMSDKYICYWQDEVHIIADKPGLCPICGSRLVKIRR